MPLRKSNLRSHLSLAANLLTLSLLAGCASKPWTDPLSNDHFSETRQLINELTESYKTCGRSLEGDVAVFYKDPLGKKSVSGFLQFSMPASYKFIVTNPFGQPLLAIAGDQKTYQSINVLEHKYVTGGIQSFGLRNDIPSDILNGNWGEWVTARNLRSIETISEIRGDRDKRGVWVTFGHEKNEPAGKSHLLINTLSKKTIARFLENGNGKIFAEVTYDNYVQQGECYQPQEIHIAGLDYGTDIRFKFTQVRLSDETYQFRLPVPPGYTKQILP